MRDIAHLGAFWPRISEYVQSRMRVGVRGELLHAVVRKWMRQMCFLPCSLLRVRPLSRVKCVQVSPAVG